MDMETNLFVQGFWAKCRDIVRPELDLLIDRLEGHGHEAHVSSQEYEEGDRASIETGPLLKISIGTRAFLRFRGDVARRLVEITDSAGALRSFELAALDAPAVKGLLANWTSKLG